MRRTLLAVLLAGCEIGCGARTGLEVCHDGGPGCVAEIPPPPCEPRAETCDAIDDDCDGMVDEALGFGPIAGPFEVVNESHGMFTSDLVAVESGMVSVWNVGFDGSRPPRTNAFARLLDRDGRPAAEVHEILNRPVTQGLTAAPSPRGIVLTYCGRFGADDHAATAFLDARGAGIGSESVLGGGRSCGAVVQAGVWTGAVHLFSWITNSGLTDGTYPVFLHVADANGALLSEREAERRGDLYTAPSFAVSGGVVALAYGVRPEIRRSAIDVARLSSDGVAIGPPIRVGESPVEDHAYAHAQVLADPDGGFVVIATDPNGPGIYAARITVSGTVVQTLTLIETSGRRFEQVDLAARRGGGFVMVANAYLGPESTFYAATIDRSLQITATWEPGAALPYQLVPALEASTGRIFVQGGDPDGTHLQVRELGCRP